MKVWQLKKINEYAKNNSFILDYEGLLALDYDDINKIIAFIDVNNKNVDDVIKFMVWTIREPEWINGFKHLDGIENFNIREYLIKIMVSAHGNTANEILQNFDFDGIAEKLNLFNNIEEYKSYIENIRESIGNRESLVISNLEFILETTKDYGSRCDLIKMVMEYSQRGDFNPGLLSDFFGDLKLEKDIVKALLLLVEGYDTEAVSNLFIKWNNDLNELPNGPKFINDNYENVITYLKESKLFNHLKDSASLINIFVDNPCVDYNNIVGLLKEIEENEDKELFEYCLDKEYILAIPVLREYAREILKAKQQNNDYRDSLIYILNKDVIANYGFCETEQNIAKIQQILSLTLISDDSSIDMAEFIGNVHHATIMKNISITQENRDTRRVLYNEFPKFIISRKLSTNQIENYADWLKELSCLSADICLKVMNIINIPLVKNMNIELQEKIKEIVLNPENFGSLDYIYTEYSNKEASCNQKSNDSENNSKEENCNQKTNDSDPLTKLITVSELLENNYDIDKVLEGFDQDDEISPKTLIRSLSYKNNQK